MASQAAPRDIIGSMIRGMAPICCVVLLSAACGRLGYEALSEAERDAGVEQIDSSIGDPDAFTGCEDGCATGSATLEIRDALGIGVPDIEVVVSFPDGALAGVVTTDSSGIAPIDIVPSGMVTIPLLVPGIGGPAFLLTLAGVQPGDALVFGSIDPGGSSSSIMVNMPGDFAGATQYTTTSGCGSSASSSSGTSQMSLSYDPSCDGALIFAVAKDSQGDPIAWSQAKVLLPLPSQVTLNSWNTSFSSGSLDLSSSGVSAVMADATVAPMSGAATFPVDDLGTIGAGSTPFKLPTGFGSRWSTEITQTIQTSQNEGYDSLLNRVTDQVPTTVAINTTTDMLPGFSNVGMNLVNASRPEVSWTAQPGLAAADMGLGILLWEAQQSLGQWIILFPPDGGSSIQAPELPESMAAQRPSGPMIQSALYFVDTDFINSYDDARANPNLEGLFGNSEAPFTPPATGPYEVRASVSSGPFGPAP